MREITKPEGNRSNKQKKGTVLEGREMRNSHVHHLQNSSLTQPESISNSTRIVQAYLHHCYNWRCVHMCRCNSILETRWAYLMRSETQKSKFVLSPVENCSKESAGNLKLKTEILLRLTKTGTALRTLLGWATWRCSLTFVQGILSGLLKTCHPGPREELSQESKVHSKHALASISSSAILIYSPWVCF